MKEENRVNEILNSLIRTGSEISYLDELKDRSLKLVKSDISLEEILNEIANELKNETDRFLHQQNKYGISFISGISTCIYLPSINNSGEYKLKLIGGNRSRNLELKVDENTLFDVASITKLFTLLLVFKLEEQGLINLNDKICDINPDFQNLEDFTFNDLIKLHGEYITDGLISKASSREEAYRILKTVYLSSNTREQNKYNDFGAMIIGDTLEKVMSKYLGKEVTFEYIMKEYLLKPLNLNNTMFNPKTNNISGNGNNLGLVHDPKARILGGALGHAGIFTTSDDLARLSKELYSLNYINRRHIKELGQVTFPNSIQSQKGNLGIYVKHPLGYESTFTPPEFSNGSFSHQGWTGALASFDPSNSIHSNILVNAIYENDNKDLIKNDKPVGYMDAFVEYQINVIRNIMLMYIAKQYYNKYCNIKEDIDITKFIK